MHLSIFPQQCCFISITSDHHRYCGTCSSACTIPCSICFFTISEPKPVEQSSGEGKQQSTEPGPSTEVQRSESQPGASDETPKTPKTDETADQTQVSDKAVEEKGATETATENKVPEDTAGDNQPAENPPADTDAAEDVKKAVDEDESDVKNLTERIISASLEREQSVMGQGDLLPACVRLC